MDIQSYLKAGYPALSILTLEPLRAAKSLETGQWDAVEWDCLRGIREQVSGQILDDVVDPLEAVKWLGSHTDTVLIAHNFHHFTDSVEIIQAIQNCIPLWKGSGCCLILMGSNVQLPVEVDSFFTTLQFSLPGLDQLQAIQQELADSVGVEINEESIEAALGLTEFESETAFALSLVQKQCLCPEVVTRQKMQMIKRTGLMEFWPPVPVDQVGGLHQFKAYLENRKKAYAPGNGHLPKPKALLLVGIPGTGKSLSCKAAASILGWPLIRLDLSALKGSLVGESERRIRQATATIDAFGKAVVWLDEIDKGFSGVASSGKTDGGTVAGMFGHFLTWLQETTSPILVMATANGIQELPPELLRAGRFDAVFFVDIPTVGERAEIIQIMNTRYGSDIPVDYAKGLEGWSGSEIEQLAKDSLFDGLEQAFKNIVPLSMTMKEAINSLQSWAETRARKANDKPGINTTNVRRIQNHVTHQ